MPTLVVDNFKGSMTQYVNGDINSGLSSVYESSGAAPFLSPGKLTWGAGASRIDPSESVITDLIMDGKERVESGILYVYAIGHTGRVYKIQVNNPATYNPDYDNPVLLATITSGSPTFTRGGFIDFFGATEKIYIGHDKGVTTINFDGTSESAVSGTWTQTVPRPLKQFIGKLYIGNGSNIAEIDSTGTVTSSTKLSPGFPTNSQVRDMDVAPDGNYIQIVVSNLALGDITSASEDTSRTASVGSYIFKWNGIDVGYTSFNSFPAFSLTANTMFQNYQYTFGYDQNGGAVFNPSDKILSLQEVIMPLPNAVASIGNLVTFFSPLSFGGFMETELFVYGPVDFEQSLGFWDLYFQIATGTETDVVRTPCQIPVSNFGIGASSNGYASNIFSNSKVYFSSLETSSAPTIKYKLYKLNLFSSSYATGDAFVDAVYQTQNQLFSKKVMVKEVRIYGEPWVTNNSFSIDLMGSGDTSTPITGGSKTFTAGSNLTIGEDYAWYNPQIEPTYSLGLRITNLGTANHRINKIEIDYTEGGK